MGVFKCIVDFKTSNKIPPNLKGLGRDEFISRTFGELWRLYRARGGLLTFDEFAYIHLRTLREFLRNSNENLSTRYKSVEQFIDKWLENNEHKHAWKFREYIDHFYTGEFRELKKTVSELPTLKQRIEFSYSYVNAYLYTQHIGKLDAEKILETEKRYLGWADKAFSSLTFWLLFSAGLHVENWLSNVYVASRSIEAVKEAYSDNLVIEKVYEFDKSEGMFDKFQRDFLNWDTAKEIIVSAVSDFVSNELAAVFQKSLATFMIYLARGAWLLASFHPKLRLLSWSARGLAALAHIVERSFLARLATWIGIEWQLDAWFQTALSNVAKSFNLFPDEFGGLLRAEWNELFDYTMRSIFAPETLQKWQLEVIEEYQKRMTSEAKAFYVSSVLQYETLGRIKNLRYLYNNEQVQKTLGLSEAQIQKLNKILVTLEWEVRNAFRNEEPKSFIEATFETIDAILKGRDKEEEFVKKLELLRKIRDKVKEGIEKNLQRIREEAERGRKGDLSKAGTMAYSWVETYNNAGTIFRNPSSILLLMKKSDYYEIFKDYKLTRVVNDYGDYVEVEIQYDIEKTEYYSRYQVVKAMFWLVRYPEQVLTLAGPFFVYGYRYYTQNSIFTADKREGEGKILTRDDIAQLIYEGFQIELRNAKAIKDSPFAYLTLTKRSNALRVAFRGDCAIIERAKHRIRKLINTLEPVEIEKHFAKLEIVLYDEGVENTV